MTSFSPNLPFRASPHRVSPRRALLASHRDAVVGLAGDALAGLFRQELHQLLLGLSLGDARLVQVLLEARSGTDGMRGEPDGTKTEH